MNVKGLDYTALTIAIIGAVNWGLIGFFSFDLVAWICGNMSWLSRVIYALVGLSGLYIISLYGRVTGMSASGIKNDEFSDVLSTQKSCHWQLFCTL